MKFRVISGGQAGVDRAAWRAAKALGIPTGGLMPPGFLAEDGRHPEFADLYGASELTMCGVWNPADAYRMRTFLNVREADLTLWLGEAKSRGGTATYRAFREKVGDDGRDPGVLYVREGWIAVPRDCVHTGWRDEESVAATIRGMPHEVINVAGNRESSDPGVGGWAEAYLTNLFRLLLEAP